MDDLPSAPEGSISEVEKEDYSSTPAPEQQEVSVPTRHDDDEAREIEAAFTKTEERTDELKQEARDEGAKLAQQSKETPEFTQPDQEIPKPPTQGDQQLEHPQPQPQMHPLTNFALASSEQRAILREQLRAENGEVKKAA